MANEVNKPKAAKRSKKQRVAVPTGKLHVQSTFNNTIVTFTDKKGNVLSQSSAGACGFRGSKKAATIAKDKHNLSSVDVFVKGVGLGRDAAIRAMSGVEIKVESIKDVTGVPHGGVRPKKARRA